MNRFFSRGKRTEVTLLAPLSGSILPLSQVPDPVFSQEMMGKGIAIQPTEGLLVAPLEGVVAHLFPTHHAILMKSDNGLDILMHIGIDTVKANGNGFAPFVSTGSRVKAGEPLLSFDLDILSEAGYPLVTPVIIANPERITDMQLSGQERVQAGQHPLLTLSLKP